MLVLCQCNGHPASTSEVCSRTWMKRVFSTGILFERKSSHSQNEAGGNRFSEVHVRYGRGNPVTLRVFVVPLGSLPGAGLIIL